MQLKVQWTGRFLSLTLLWCKHQSQTLPTQCKTHTTYAGMRANRFSTTKAPAAHKQGAITASRPACDLNDALLQRSHVLTIQPALQPMLASPALSISFRASQPLCHLGYAIPNHARTPRADLKRNVNCTCMKRAAL